MAGEEGTCMFVWECLKTDGKHLGMCMDGFMFGSCCVHNDDQNTVLDNKVKEKPGKKNVQVKKSLTKCKQTADNIF